MMYLCECVVIMLVVISVAIGVQGLSDASQDKTVSIYQRPKQEPGCLLSNICTTCAEMKMIDNKDECQLESSEGKACIRKHMPECKHILDIDLERRKDRLEHHRRLPVVWPMRQRESYRVQRMPGRRPTGSSLLQSRDDTGNIKQVNTGDDRRNRFSPVEDIEREWGTRPALDFRAWGSRPVTTSPSTLDIERTLPELDHDTAKLMPKALQSVDNKAFELRHWFEGGDVRGVYEEGRPTRSLNAWLLSRRADVDSPSTEHGSKRRPDEDSRPTPNPKALQSYTEVDNEALESRHWQRDNAHELKRFRAISNVLVMVPGGFPTAEPTTEGAW